MENDLRELHCTLSMVDLPVPHWLATDQALKFVRLHRVTAAILNTVIGLQNFMSRW